MTVEEAKQAIVSVNEHCEGNTYGALADAIEALVDAKIAEAKPVDEPEAEVESSSKKSNKKSKSDE